MEAKLQDVKQTMKARMHEPLRVAGEWLLELARKSGYLPLGTFDQGLVKLSGT